MQMLKRPILDNFKSDAERLEEKGICLPSYTSSDADPFSSFSIGKPSISDTTNIVSQTNSEHCWPELVDLLVTTPPSDNLQELLNRVTLIHDNTDVAGNASAPARVVLEQTSAGNIDRGDSLRKKVAKMNKEWIFVTINLVIELLSAAFDQLSSVQNPRYALIAMLMSFAAAVICIIELAYKAGKQRVIWRWESSKLPWFYYSSPSNKPFGTFPEIIGLTCAILQSISSASVYTFYLQHADYPIKISFWPLVFAIGLLCTKFMQNPDQKAAFRRN